jgi:acyl-coenzyme A thioesterase PaaI-like protein
MWSSGEPGRSYPAMGASPDIDSAERRDRRLAIDELGAVLRDVVEQAVATEAPADDLRQVAALIRQVLAPLGKELRRREQLPSADDLLGGIRMYNPVTGTGNALSPPLRIEIVDGRVVGSCTLGLAFEGPPMYVHGGVSALLLDQMLGFAICAAGQPGLTVELVNQYHAPVPLQDPLHLTAEVTEVDGRKVTARGTIATARQPDRTLVEAVGRFVALRPEQALLLFAAALNPDATNPAAAHD